MPIHGLQKVTLLDYPDRIACSVFFAGCNFRCPFCHNASLVTRIDPENAISQEKVLTYLRKRSGVLDGVCITGGEPLLDPGLEEFLHSIKSLGYSVKLDTNGSNPSRMRKLVSDGLVDYVAMDIKNSPARYGVSIGIDNYDTKDIEASAEYLLSGPVEYEFRTTVVQELHRRKDFEEIGRWLRGADQYYLQTFVDSGDLIRPGYHAFSHNIMEQALEIVSAYIPNAALRGTE